MKCQLNLLLYIVICSLCVQYAQSEPPKPKQQPQPLVFRSWPPNRNQGSIRNSMLMAFRGAGSSNIVSRVPVPSMYIKSGAPIRFAVPMHSRPKGSQPAPSNHVFFKAGPPQSQAYNRPYAAHLTSSPGVFKFSAPHKTAIKFQSPPPVPLKSKPEFIYEKVNVPKYSDPVRFNIGSDGAIHTIPAPNLGVNHHSAPAPEASLNNQLDNDLTKFSAHGFSLNKPVHQYQVNENINDLAYKHAASGQHGYYAPDNDPSLKTTSVQHVHDPLSTPSDGKQKPADILYHQTIDFGASPLIQGPHYSLEPFGFPVTSQPQLQQYHLQQSNMMKQGMPLANLNPTYLVMQSNNLLGQHQQHHQHQLFRPENGYIDTSVTAQPGITYHSFEYTNPQQAASLGQIYSAQQDQLHQQGISSTPTPTTVSSFSHTSESQDNPSYSHVVEPKPSHYQYSQQNFIDLPEEHLTQNDIENLLNYNDGYHEYISQRQVENDHILREAQEKLQSKLHIHQQQQQSAYDLHQLVQQEKYHPLRIVVPDDEQGFKKRVDDEEITYEDDDADLEDDEDDSREHETASKGAKSS